MLVILPLPVPMSVMMLTMLLRSCPHLYLPAFPGSARGRCYYKPSHLPPSPLPLLVQCVSCTDAQLPSLFIQHYRCTALLPKRPCLWLPVCAVHCSSSFHRGAEQIYAREGGLVPGLPLSASVPTPGASHLPPNLSASQCPPSAMRCCISLGTQLAFHNAAQ